MDSQNVVVDLFKSYPKISIGIATIISLIFVYTFSFFTQGRVVASFLSLDDAIELEVGEKLQQKVKNKIKYCYSDQFILSNEQKTYNAKIYAEKDDSLKIYFSAGGYGNRDNIKVIFAFDNRVIDTNIIELIPPKDISPHLKGADCIARKNNENIHNLDFTLDTNSDTTFNTQVKVHYIVQLWDKNYED